MNTLRVIIVIIILTSLGCNSKKQTASNSDMPGMKMDSNSKQSMQNPDSVRGMGSMKMSPGNMQDMQNPDTGMGGMQMSVNDKGTSDSMKGMTETGSDVYYTCSMHPGIRETKPGKCPICGMELIATGINKTSVAGEIKLSAQQEQLGNVRADTVQNGMLGDNIVLTATLSVDQNKTTSVSVRIMGRIERLYYKNIGDFVKKGDPIYDLYSEDLNTAKQELIEALERKSTFGSSIIDIDKIIQSAKNKLLLWGMSEAQIDELTRTRKTNITTTFYSNVSGFISTLERKEGDYAMEGSTLMRLSDLSTLWAEAQVYSSEMSLIDKNAVAEVQVADFPGKIINGSIEFINPEINPGTKIDLLRISIPNPDNLLKPGMPAYVFIKKPQHNMISLPIDAVIRDGKGATVWLKIGAHTYKSVMVQVGMETGNRIEIVSGLKKGDIVVVSGTYLLNSEYIFKEGANPMSGMKM